MSELSENDNGYGLPPDGFYDETNPAPEPSEPAVTSPQEDIDDFMYNSLVKSTRNSREAETAFAIAIIGYVNIFFLLITLGISMYKTDKTDNFYQNLIIGLSIFSVIVNLGLYTLFIVIPTLDIKFTTQQLKAINGIVLGINVLYLFLYMYFLKIVHNSLNSEIVFLSNFTFKFSLTVFLLTTISIIFMTLTQLTSENETNDENNTKKNNENDKVQINQNGGKYYFKSLFNTEQKINKEDSKRMYFGTVFVNIIFFFMISIYLVMKLNTKTKYYEKASPILYFFVILSLFASIASSIFVILLIKEKYFYPDYYQTILCALAVILSLPATYYIGYSSKNFTQKLLAVIILLIITAVNAFVIYHTWKVSEKKFDKYFNEKLNAETEEESQ